MSWEGETPREGARFLGRRDTSGRRRKKKKSKKKKLRKNPPPPPPAPSLPIAACPPAALARLAKIPQPDPALKCPQCDSTNTKSCYFNNCSLSQPRYLHPRGGPPLGGGHLRPRRSRGPRCSRGQQQRPRRGEDLGNK
uniref:Dof-type domain-containing protein n=1 Tax=Ananas comosus var. bracteatus TaxID=296719 RepID=A0A6V7PLX3_ANACO|nr:unnamed protein product [Ananas comosus var. bracteatus]